MVFGYAKLDRVGVIDVGSNSVRLVVFDGAARSPAYFYNEKVLCGLGRGISQTGALHVEGRARALATMDRFAALAKSMKVQTLRAVATAAVREASDGPSFCTEVRVRTGIDISVASGIEEARFSAQGVLLGWPTAYGLMCDIGGASLELAELENGRVGRCQTSALAPLKLAHLADDDAALTQYIGGTVANLRAKIDSDHDHMFLVGGSFRAIARLDMVRRDYPLDVLHEYKLLARDMLQTLDWILTTPEDALAGMTRTSSERMKLVPMAARVLRELIHGFDPRVIAISSYGLREGVLYEQMPQSLRDKDPLLEACAWMEKTSSRFVGFGDELAQWILPILPDLDEAKIRLVRAACLLHDTSWREHPGHRSEVCFDNAARTNLGGLDHTGRVFLGMALLNRYKTVGKKNRAERLANLLTEQERDMAVVIGRAMRLGAALAGGSISVLAKSKLTIHGQDLVLELPPKYARFGGEAVEKRLRSLAGAMALNPMVS